MARKPKPSTGLTQKAFLAAYRECGHVYRAAEFAKVSARSHFLWLKKYPEYKRKFEQAYKEVTAKLEDEAIRRAYHGTEVYKFYQGVAIMDPLNKEKPYIEREYSDALLMFMLKKRDPSYRDNAPVQVIENAKVIRVPWPPPLPAPDDKPKLESADEPQG